MTAKNRTVNVIVFGPRPIWRARRWLAQRRNRGAGPGENEGNARLEAAALFRTVGKNGHDGNSILRSIVPTEDELATLRKITPRQDLLGVRAALAYRKAVAIEFELLIAEEAERNAKREQRRRTPSGGPTPSSGSPSASSKSFTMKGSTYRKVFCSNVFWTASANGCPVRKRRR
jgi:hypothetical protein